MSKSAGIVKGDTRTQFFFLFPKQQCTADILQQDTECHTTDDGVHESRRESVKRSRRHLLLSQAAANFPTTASSLVQQGSKSDKN